MNLKSNGDWWVKQKILESFPNSNSAQTFPCFLLRPLKFIENACQNPHSNHSVERQYNPQGDNYSSSSTFLQPSPAVGMNVVLLKFPIVYSACIIISNFSLFFVSKAYCLQERCLVSISTWLSDLKITQLSVFSFNTTN